MGHTSNLNLSWDKHELGLEEPIFLGFDLEREENIERGEPRLPPKNYGVQLVDFRLAKNESSSHRRGVRVGT